jgi:hypothetical protein
VSQPPHDGAPTATGIIISAQPTVVIQIDRGSFQLHRGTLTGAELRQLPNPEIAADRDLFLVAGGGEDDRLIHDQQRLELADGMSFFTVPRTILAGLQNCHLKRGSGRGRMCRANDVSQ